MLENLKAIYRSVITERRGLNQHIDMLKRINFLFRLFNNLTLLFNTLTNDYFDLIDT